MDPTDAHDLSLRVRFNLLRLRTRRNVSRSELAKRSGISAASIALMEEKQNVPTTASLCALARGLRVDITELLRPVKRAADPAPVEKSWIHQKLPHLSDADIASFRAGIDSDVRREVFDLAMCSAPRVPVHDVAHKLLRSSSYVHRISQQMFRQLEEAFPSTTAR